MHITGPVRRVNPLEGVSFLRPAITAGFAIQVAAHHEMLERIGNCRILEEVASGGMAVVYRAIQEQLNRVVAIKALKSSASVDQQLVTRFEREARSLAGLQHENIIHIYDFHRERGALFIVMEYVRGIDLYDLLERSGRLPYDVVARADPR